MTLWLRLRSAVTPSVGSAAVAHARLRRALGRDHARPSRVPPEVMLARLLDELPPTPRDRRSECCCLAAEGADG